MPDQETPQTEVVEQPQPGAVPDPMQPLDGRLEPDAQAEPPSVAEQAATLEMMLDLPLEVTVELGRARMQLGEALSLQPGAIIELNRLPGEPLEMYVNDRLVARGEVVVANDVLALRVAELVGDGNTGAARR